MTLNRTKFKVRGPARLVFALQRRTRDRFAALSCLFALCGFASGCGVAGTTSSDIAAQQESENAAPDDAPTRGVNLGSFVIQETRPIENQKIDLRFSVQAAVTEAKRAELEKLVATREHAIRDQIITAVRTADSPEFDEPELKILRRRMVLRIRSILEESLIDDLLLTDYRYQVE